MKIILALLLTASLTQAATISWSPVDGATGYRVYTSTNQYATMPWTLVASVTGTNVVVQEAANATNYFYGTVMSVDGESMPSDIAFHPRTPTAKLSSGLASDTITITPNPLSDKVTQYSVYWSLDKNAAWPWSLIASNSSAVITVTGNYSQGMKNCYVVIAESLSGKSLASSPPMVRIPGNKIYVSGQ